jgi:hypothetical protein
MSSLQLKADRTRSQFRLRDLMYHTDPFALDDILTDILLNRLSRTSASITSVIFKPTYLVISRQSHQLSAFRAHARLILKNLLSLHETTWSGQQRICMHLLCIARHPVWLRIWRVHGQLPESGLALFAKRQTVNSDTVFAFNSPLVENYRARRVKEDVAYW